MSFSLPWSVNKFVSTYINDSNAITGSYNSVSFRVLGDTELNHSTITSLGVNKPVNVAYAIDASGNVNISGSVSASTLSVASSSITNLGLNKPSNTTYVLDASGNTNVSGSGQFLRLGVNTTPNSFYAINANGTVNVSGLVSASTLSVASGAFTSSTIATTFTKLPTSTATPSASSDLTTKTYVDSAVAGGGSGLLSSNNTWTGINTFTNLIPYFSSSNQTFLRLGTNTAQYQTNSSTNNVAFGDNCFKGLSAGSGVNACTNGVYIGASAGSSMSSYINPSDDNVYIGYNAGAGNYYGASRSVLIGSQVLHTAIGNSDNVIIGYNACGLGTFGMSNCVIIGSNSCVNYSNIGSQINSVIVGSSNLPNLAGNNIICFGYNNGTNATDNNSGMWIGTNSGANNTSNGNYFISHYSGNSLTNGFNNIIIGNYCDFPSGSTYNAQCLGHGITFKNNNECVVGGTSPDNLGGFYTSRLRLNTKMMPYSTQITPSSGTVFNLSFDTPEFVLLTSNITTIVLPNPFNQYPGGTVATNFCIGAGFTFIKNYSSAVAVTIYTYNGYNSLTPVQNIIINGSTSTNILFSSTEYNISVVCVDNQIQPTYGTTIWAVENSQQLPNYAKLNAANTFTVAPTMSGANITAATIPDSALSSNIARLNAANTFTIAPTMSGANITAATIPDSALAATNLAKTNTSNTFKTGYNTFSDGATSSLRPAYQNPLYFFYNKPQPTGTNYRYYFRNGVNVGSDTITFDVDTTVKYYMVGAGGGGAGNISTNVLGGGGGGAGQFLTGTFTALAGVTYTLTTGAYTSTGSNGGTITTLAGGNGSNCTISGAGLTTITALGGSGGASHTSTAPAGKGGNGGAGGVGGNGATTTGTIGSVGGSVGGGAGGSYNFATSALGNSSTATMDDGLVLTFKGGNGGANNATSGVDATTFGNGGGGGGGTSTQKGGNGLYGFVVLQVAPYTYETYLWNPAYGITSSLVENSRLIATTEYVKNQYSYNNNFTNIVNINSTSSLTTTSTGVNGVLQITPYPVASTSTGQDPVGIRSVVDTNNIINFANASGVARGAIAGTSATAVAYNTTSDERLKENIVTMPSQLENIKTLSSRNFSWKSTGISDSGFIAQEIFKVYPDLNPLKNSEKYDDILYPVKQDGSNFIHMVDYGRMTPYLWSAVQELTLLVEKQQQQINELMSIIKST